MIVDVWGYDSSMGGGILVRLWHALKSWLVSDNKDSGADTYGNPELHPLRPAELERTLDIPQQARELGQHEIPPSNAIVLTGPELQVVQAVDKARQDYANWAAQRGNELQKTIDQTDLEPTCRRLLHLDQEFERKAGALLTDWRSSLTRLQKTIDEVSEEYNKFCEKNRREHPAKIPSSSGILLRRIVLIALIVAEGGVNSFFFARGMWGGHIDGLISALLFAGANIVLAYSYGRLVLPEIFHVNLLRKALGSLLFLAALATSVAFAFLIAHYRDAVVGGALDAAAEVAWNTFRANTFQLRDAQSVLLCGLSIGFALLAVVDALGMDDRYPGYGDITRRKNQAIQDFDQEFALVWQVVDASKTEALTDVTRTLDSMRMALHQMHEAIGRKSSTAITLENAFKNVDNTVDLLIAKFRDINLANRRSPRPAYFDTRPALRPVERIDLSTDQDEKKYEAQCQVLRNAESGIERVRASIQSSYTRLFEGVKPLEEHFKAVRERQ